jgi:cell division protein FtsA
VIPLGSANITKDIASLSIDENQADQLKISYGYISEELSEEEAKSPVLTLPDGEPVTKQKLAIVIEARLEEIQTNVKEQIITSGYPLGTLLSGAVLIGGGANLKNMEKSFKKVVGVSKVRVAKSTQTNVRYTKQLNKYFGDTKLFAAISLLAKGTQSCTGTPVSTNQPTSIFGDTDTKPAADNPAPAPDEPKAPDEPEKEKPKEEEKKKKGPSAIKRFTRWLKSTSDKIAGDD